MISNAEYTPFYYLLITFFTFIFSLPLLKLKYVNNIPKIIERGGVFIFLIIPILFIGLRDPYDNDIYFGDTIRYTYFYEYLNRTEPYKDIGYYIYMYFFKNILHFSIVLFYVSTAFLYVYIQYLAVKKMHLKNTLYLLIVIVTTMSFWNYGVNGIRSGLASALFLYGLTLSNKYVRIILFISSFLIHKSFLLPIAIFYLVPLYGNVKFYIRIWIIAVFISIAIGPLILNFVSSNLSFLISESDDRVNTYIANSSTSTEGGRFRIDFILYSMIPIILAYYYIFYKKYNNNFYTRILKLYILTNTIWILLIYANFTNRFAYLSWVLIPILLIYPLIKQNNLLKNQNLFLWCIIILNMGFTLLMFYKNSLS
ncbi:EpsG family protein [Empedobacter falsenii]|uniref:EpsG family protein n=1 Tax=Empedobacter falsenii TaxID=343874 RepID=A0A376FYG0_9FLAO|nr:EpsG family protein [Empedobacter falsenii]STD53409.1 Uncharacterised protein [Empedobacter falsenii]